MHVHRRHPFLDRADQVGVAGDGQFRVDPALHAHLGGAGDVRLPRAVRDLGRGQGEGVGVTLALRERAEPAAGVADVGEVDVPVHHVGDVVADRVAAQLIGQRDDRLETRPVRVCEGDVLGVGASGRVLLGGAQRGEHVPVQPHRGVRAERKDLLAHGVPVAECAAEVGAVLGVATGDVDPGVQIHAAAGLPVEVGLLPRVSLRGHVPGQTGLRVRQRSDVSTDPRVDPRLPRQDVLRLGRDPLGEGEPGVGTELREQIQVRPRPFRVDVVRCQG